MIKLLIADDHDIVRTGLKKILSDYKNVKIVGEVASGEEAIEFVKKQKPDVVIMDISMPGMGGLEATKRINERWPKIKILVLTVHPEDTYAVRILKAGALGYLQKNCTPQELITGIKTVHRGKRYLLPDTAQRIAYKLLESKEDLGPVETLSDRELQVLYLLASGFEMKEIAAKLKISYKTVETYRSRLMDKLKLRNVAGLTKFAIRHKLIDI